MKKIFLIAAFGAAGLFSAKGINVDEKVEKKQESEQKAPVRACGVVVTYWVGGQYAGQETITSDQPDLGSCQAFQAGVIAALQMAGFWTT